ncbi:MAG TPA: replicative DNA helicase [Phycisphaerae bacterium]|nr:replicative DNA helicase [Phycisphaerae bacterium]
MTRLSTTKNSDAAGAADRQSGFDRMPPQSLDAEMSLLGSLMLDRESVGDIITIIGRSDARWFYRPDHRQIFETLVDLYDANQPIDLVILRNELEKRGLLAQVGGVEYLVACAESVPTAVNAEHYARIVRDKGLLRDLISCIGEIQEDAYSGSQSSTEIFDQAEQKLFAVTEQRVAGHTVPLSELIIELDHIINSTDASQISGLPTGFSELDELTTGFQPGDMIVVAGRPSMGKTALGLNMAEHAAVTEHIPVAFFSLEMSRQQVAQRMLCSRAGIDSHKFRQRMLNDEERRHIADVCEELQGAPLFVDDTPGITPMELRAKARRLKMQHDIKAVFVDYLQLMHAPGHESRQQEISYISRSLKALGRELGIPIVALAQLNRQTEGRTGNQPRMSDLRESGAIEQDADAVLLIHREEYYKRDDPTLKGKALLIIAKQRNGPTGDVDLTFDHQSTCFKNFSPISADSYAPAYGDAPF